MSDTKNQPESGIARASRLAGGQVELAKKLNAGAGARQDRKHVSQQAISLWIRQGFVPTNRAIEISECVRDRIPPHDLIDPKLRNILIRMSSPSSGSDK